MKEKVKELFQDLEKFKELSAYKGGHDALRGLTKKGRAKYFKNNFSEILNNKL